MENYVIELKNISKSFGDNVILENFDFKVKKDEFLTILGPSGCGKTTILRLIGGFEEPDEGQILFNGEDITNKEAYERRINTVFQKYALFPHMNVFDNIAFGLKIKKMDKKVIKEKVKEVLKLVNLVGFENREIESLSGGQQQRLCIARALAVNPEVILMDEPTSALDPISTGKIEDLAQDLKDKYTIVMVTHNMQQASRISDQTIFLLNGVIVEKGKTVDIFTNPREEKTELYVTGRFG